MLTDRKVQVILYSVCLSLSVLVSSCHFLHLPCEIFCVHARAVLGSVCDILLLAFRVRPVRVACVFVGVRFKKS